MDCASWEMVAHAKPPSRPAFRPLLDELDDRCLLSGYSPFEPSGYTPAQITAAYGLNAITFTSSSAPRSRETARVRRLH